METSVQVAWTPSWLFCTVASTRVTVERGPFRQVFAVGNVVPRSNAIVAKRTAASDKRTVLPAAAVTPIQSPGPGEQVATSAEGHKAPPAPLSDRLVKTAPPAAASRVAAPTKRVVPGRAFNTAPAGIVSCVPRDTDRSSAMYRSGWSVVLLVGDNHWKLVIVAARCKSNASIPFPSPTFPVMSLDRSNAANRSRTAGSPLPPLSRMVFPFITTCLNSQSASPLTLTAGVPAVPTRTNVSFSRSTEAPRFPKPTPSRGRSLNVTPLIDVWPPSTTTPLPLGWSGVSAPTPELVIEPPLIVTAPPASKGKWLFEIVRSSAVNAPAALTLHPATVAELSRAAPPP